MLRGGKDAINSNRAIHALIVRALEESGFSPDCVGFIDDVTREGSFALLKQGKYVDVVIPRGGDGLKHFVLENAVMPVIASAGGVCHLFVEKSAALDKCISVIENAKMQRPSTKTSRTRAAASPPAPKARLSWIKLACPAFWRAKKTSKKSIRTMS